MGNTFGINIPFVQLLGFELTHFEGGESEIRYAPRPEHLNSFGVLHGGACMTVLDVGMATAARSADKEMGVVTIEMKTTFMQAATGPVTCKGRLMHRTASMAFTEATLYDGEGKACAHATGTFKYIKRLPTSARSANPLDVISTD